MNLIEEIDQLLGIKLEKKLYGKLYNANQKNTYSESAQGPTSLRLDDVKITNFFELLPLLKGIRNLTIKNSTIPNFFELLDLELHDLVLNTVHIKSNKCDKKGIMPWHLKFLNMKLDANCLKCFKGSNVIGFKQVEFRKCHIDNIQHINDLEPVSLLILDKITFTHKPKKSSKKKTRRLSIYNSNFKDVSFLPFQGSLVDIQFKNCKIGSIAGLSKLPELRDISIDSNSKIKDKSVQKNPLGKKINCVFSQGKQPMDLSMIVPLKKYIKHLQLNDFSGKMINSIEEFDKIKHLSFNQSTIYVNAFLPIAKQIESFSITNSRIKKHKYFAKFTNIRNLSAQYYGDDGARLKSFKKIHPLKNQLKTLDIYDFKKIADPQLLGDFKTLHSLKIGYAVPLETAEYVLNLKKLKKLSLCVDDDKRTLSLKNLKNLESLILKTTIKFVGFEHLRKLKALKIGGDMIHSSININKLPTMKSLKRLNINDYETKIKGMERFPNLKHLRIKGCFKLKLPSLKNLKVLVLDNASIDNLSTFEVLPNLKKLDLSNIYVNINLEGMHKFPNLKALTFLESCITDISQLEPLKGLKILDLYATKISDVRVLNSLPKLKEVNLATSSNDNLEEQLDKPEIAIYCGLPTIYLSIWRNNKFGI